jgi:hypothetical protein
MLTQQPIAGALLSRFRAVRGASMQFSSPLTPEVAPGAHFVVL